MAPQAGELHLETLRWARENGCPWDAATRDQAEAELGYTDDLGNLWGGDSRRATRSKGKKIGHAR